MLQSIETKWRTFPYINYSPGISRFDFLIGPFSLTSSFTMYDYFKEVENLINIFCMI